MVKLIKLIVVQVTVVSQLIFISEAGIAGLIASAALMSMFRPKVIPIPLPLPVPVPVPVPIRSKSPLNPFNTDHSTSNNHNNPYQNLPYSQQYIPSSISSPMTSQMTLPYLHHFHSPFTSFPHHMPPQIPYHHSHHSMGHLMTSHPMAQRMILPIGMLPQPASAYYHDHHPAYYRPHPFFDHPVYHQNHANPTLYPDPFVVYV
ncbi:uncharacterized protein LOC107369637 [Tetranychus urticae]|uniref:Uncharacterized protein n=1 Tax=Tetranychus urticae TaxID=32264 RepID=T1L2K0_TETUR|nr:uncharacterized protein LOC107369637 [Tetranychus urticae]